MFSIYVFPRPPAVVIGGQLTTTTRRTRSSNNASVAKIGLGPKIEYVIQVTTTPMDSHLYHYHTPHISYHYNHNHLCHICHA